MQLSRRIRRAAVLMAAVLALLSASPAQAQLDPGNFDLYQNGARVGEVYVPSCPSTGSCLEHWVLFRGYVHPGPGAPVQTTILPVRGRYTSEADFFARVPWGEGFHYARVSTSESDTLPGR